MVEDALELKSFLNGFFDVVRSLESCEQFYGKELFLLQALRVLKKNGRVVMAARCSGGDSYSGSEAGLYRRICRAFDLPYMRSKDHYDRILGSVGFRTADVRDWTGNVEKSRDVGINLMNACSIFSILAAVGIRRLVFSKQLKLIKRAYRDKLVNCIVFTAEKKNMPDDRPGIEFFSCL